MRSLHEELERYKNMGYLGSSFMGLIDPSAQFHRDITNVDLANRALEEASKSWLTDYHEVNAIDMEATRMMDLAGGISKEALEFARRTTSPEYYLHDTEFGALAGLSGIGGTFDLLGLTEAPLAPQSLAEMLEATHVSIEEEQRKLLESAMATTRLGVEWPTQSIAGMFSPSPEENHLPIIGQFPGLSEQLIQFAAQRGEEQLLASFRPSVSDRQLTQLFEDAMAGTLWPGSAMEVLHSTAGLEAFADERRVYAAMDDALKRLAPEIPEQYTKTLSEMVREAMPSSTLAGMCQSLSMAQQSLMGLAQIGDVAQKFKDLMSLYSPAGIPELQNMVLAGAQGWDEHMRLVSPGMSVFEQAKESMSTLAMGFGTLDWAALTGEVDAAPEHTQAYFNELSTSINQQEDMQGVIEELIAHTSSLSPVLKKYVWYLIGVAVFTLWISTWKGMGTTIGSKAGDALWDYWIGSNAQEEISEQGEQGPDSSKEPLSLEHLRYINTDEALIRRNPREDAPILGKLRFGSRVAALEHGSEFSLIEWWDDEGEAKLQGWVRSRYLQKFH